jgi:hypothetical protein
MACFKAYPTPDYTAARSRIAVSIQTAPFGGNIRHENLALTATLVMAEALAGWRLPPEARTKMPTIYTRNDIVLITVHAPSARAISLQ